MPERKKELPPEALRALKEAEQRRVEKKEVNFPKFFTFLRRKT